jgi:hypothetical protein
VSPGDEVFVLGKIEEPSRLGRLYVFAKNGDAPAFSPYVPNVTELAELPTPILLSPMSMRLTDSAREKQISFTADIDGYVRVMQEVDRPDDPKAKVTLKRKICPDLPWITRISRRLGGILPWIS